MKILIIEDKPEKLKSILSELEMRFPDGGATIEQASCLSKASKLIYESPFDLIIIDLMLPLRADDNTPSDVSDELLMTISESEKNRTAHTIALTGFDDLVEEKLRAFAEAGVGLVLFENGRSQWKQTLALEIERVKAKLSIDFLIICALERERQGFRHTKASLGDPVNSHGFDCVPMTIDGLQGICLKTNRMGLVEAAIAAAKSIEHFSPRIVAMSGICAGFPGETSLGSLIATDICWEYQTGKWTDEGFKPEAYSVSISPEVRSEISTIIAADPTGQGYKKDMMHDTVMTGGLTLSPTTSGSAVISNEEAMSQIGTQHRKVAGLDMEMFSILQAASNSIQKPLFFGAKTVVDLGDTHKDSTLHTPGAALSARFVVDVIERILTK